MSGLGDLDALLLHARLFPEVTAVSMTVPWETRVKKRARVTKSGTYKEDDADEQATAAMLANQWGPRPPMTGPVALTVFAYRKDKRRADIDNVVKHIMDAGNGIVWLDDSQILALVANKIPSDPDPRTVVIVSSHPC